MSVLAQIKSWVADPMEAPVDVRQQRFLQMHWSEFMDTPTSQLQTAETCIEMDSAICWRPGPAEDNEPME